MRAARSAASHCDAPRSTSSRTSADSPDRRRAGRHRSRAGRGRRRRRPSGSARRSRSRAGSGRRRVRVDADEQSALARLACGHALAQRQRASSMRVSTTTMPGSRGAPATSRTIASVSCFSWSAGHDAGRAGVRSRRGRDRARRAARRQREAAIPVNANVSNSIHDCRIACGSGGVRSLRRKPTERLPLWLTY